MIRPLDTARILEQGRHHRHGRSAAVREAAERDFGIAAALHAGGIEEVFDIVCRQNGVPDEHASRSDLVVYIRTLGEYRDVGHIPGALLSEDWHIKRADNPALVATPREAKAFFESLGIGDGVGNADAAR